MSELHRKVKQSIDRFFPVHDKFAVELANPAPSAVDRLAAVVDERARERVAAHDQDVAQGILRVKVLKQVKPIVLTFQVPNPTPQPPESPDT